MKKIHVIIPVYNAYEDLIVCVESLIKYTDLNNHELIFINDNSSDARIFTFLKNLKKENIEVLHNGVNLGFSASVNIGIESCVGDVILLNSDTIVTKNWIEKIVACAYSDASIATVTPVSNNATLCSVPNFCEENTIPDDFTVDEFAQLIEQLSLKKYPTITVAHGFCMLIKREVIKCIGLFDAETFTRGYGEENDFCFRAEQVGYHHVMCDDTFIYHKGTASFLSEEKKQYIENNTKVLETRYKEQWEKNQEYCSIERETEIRNNISIALKLRNKKKNILYLVQADFREDASNNIGGTQLHVKDLMLGLKDTHNIFVAARDGEYLRLTAYIEKERISYKFLIGKAPEHYVFTDKTQKKLYRNILNTFSIDIVHIHHTLDLSLDLYYEAKALGIPLFATLHDFFYVCSSIKLINYKGELCIGRETNEMCSKCLKSQLNISETVDFMTNWRKQNYKALQLCDKLITPSENAKEIFSSYFPDLKEKIIVIAHGSNPSIKNVSTNIDEFVISNNYKVNFEYIFNKPSNKQLIEGWAYLEGTDSKDSQIFVHITDEFRKEEVLKANVYQRHDVAAVTKKEYLYCGFSVIVPIDTLKNGKLFIRTVILNNGQFITNENREIVKYYGYQEKKNLHVAFIGGMSPAKGSQLAHQTIKNSSKSINWYIFGGIGDEDLDSIEQENVIKTGWYQREELRSLIKSYKIDLVCILPIWPETFCYTISEALLCGVPVIGTDVGAVG
jgi:GT2 family glycosyltransferase/glycosyltransferase involved in cell wall biosynthesis